MGKKVIASIAASTVGDLLDELARIAKDPALSDVLDAAIESDSPAAFIGFRIIEETLSDKSKVLNFELVEAKLAEAL